MQSNTHWRSVSFFSFDQLNRNIIDDIDKNQSHQICRANLWDLLPISKLAVCPFQVWLFRETKKRREHGNKCWNQHPPLSNK